MPSGPKANKYFNRHSAEARQRNEERSSAAKAAAAAAAEDAQWNDENSKASKRLSKQREEERKAEEKLMREQEKRQQLMEEERELLSKAPKKVTQRELQKNLSKMLANYDKEREKLRAGQHGAVIDTHTTTTTQDESANIVVAKLPETNVNLQRRSEIEHSNVPVIQASGDIGKVLLALEEGGLHEQSTPASHITASSSIPDDRHLGKRAKVLYKLFYDEKLPIVKDENPHLRRTQYNDIIWKMWLKDPANPFVQRSEMRDREALEAERQWMEEHDEDNDKDGNNSSSSSDDKHDKEKKKDKGVSDEGKAGKHNKNSNKTDNGADTKNGEQNDKKGKSKKK